MEGVWDTIWMCLYPIDQGHRLASVGNAWNGVRAIVHKIRISSACDDPPATVPAPSHIRGRMDINLPIYYGCIDIPRCRRFEISTRSSRFVAQRAAILAALMSLRFVFPREQHTIVSNIIHPAPVDPSMEIVSYLGKKTYFRLIFFLFPRKQDISVFTKRVSLADNATWFNCIPLIKIIHNFYDRLNDDDEVHSSELRENDNFNFPILKWLNYRDIIHGFAFLVSTKINLWHGILLIWVRCKSVGTSNWKYHTAISIKKIADLIPWRILDVHIYISDNNTRSVAIFYLRKHVLIKNNLKLFERILKFQKISKNVLYKCCVIYFLQRPL